MIILLLWSLAIFACWGSFLNVVAYRITYDKPFFTKRSYCPSCEKIIAWYDNIPVLSWIILRGYCRSCRSKISVLYPATEILSALIFTTLIFTSIPQSIGQFFFYFIFFTALIVSTRTDLEAMVIPQLFSIWLIPIGFLGAHLGFLHISLLASLVGAFVGYGILWITGKSFSLFTNKEGLGIGDMELLGMIGAFLGPIGVWFTILFASISGLIIGGGYLLLSKQKRDTLIPFGPFLSLGATLFFFFKDKIITFLF